MFFRVVFLYMAKVAFVSFTLTFVGLAADGYSWGAAVRQVGMAILVPLGLLGAVIGAVLLVKRTISCPLCSRPAQFMVLSRRQPAVRCRNCGVVYVKNMLIDLRVRTLPDNGGTPNHVIGLQRD